MEKKIENEKLLTVEHFISLLPSDKVIEKNGEEGGLRDGELQMFWEGANWMSNYIRKQLSNPNR